jgi:uncharacterized protein (TIGR02466 family)
MENNMNITNLWAVPIAESIIDIDIDRTLEYISNLPYETNDEIHCKYSIDKHLHKDTFLSDVVSKIKSMSDSYASDVLGYDTKSPDYSIDIKTMWGIRMEPHNFATRHYHALSLFSGILYLNVDADGSNKIRFHTPRNNNGFVRIPCSHWNTFNCIEYSMIPEPGKLILFPSDIDHSTVANMANENLHSIVIDFSVKGVLGKGTTGELSFFMNEEQNER